MTSFSPLRAREVGEDVSQFMWAVSAELNSTATTASLAIGSNQVFSTLRKRPDGSMRALSRKHKWRETSLYCGHVAGMK